jgi:hypothetical protein
VSILLSVANKPIMLSVVMLSANMLIFVMLNVLEPDIYQYIFNIGHAFLFNFQEKQFLKQAS